MKRLLRSFIQRPRVKSFLMRSLLSPLDFRLLNFKNEGYLKDLGWFEGLDTREHLSRDGTYLPQLTYPIIEFLNERLNKELKLLEFGLGYSTMFYASKCGSVIAADHSREWVEKVRSRIGDNATILLEEVLSKYTDLVKTYEKEFDVVIIDCIDQLREGCIKSALKVVSDTGVILYDDTERAHHRKALAEIEKAGFRRLDFWGISPGAFHLRCTSLFYRDNNVLGV